MVFLVKVVYFSNSCAHFAILYTLNISLFRIFFGLASPVFHAMFYGKMKQKGDVEIVDISVEAFQCMKKYSFMTLG